MKSVFRNRSVLVALALIFFITPLLAWNFSMQFYPSGGYASCTAYVENEGQFVSLDLRIYGPDNSLLAHDAVFRSNWVSDTILAPLGGSGTYRCDVSYNYGTGSGQDSWDFDY